MDIRRNLSRATGVVVMITPCQVSSVRTVREGDEDMRGLSRDGVGRCLAISDKYMDFLRDLEATYGRAKFFEGSTTFGQQTISNVFAGRVGVVHTDRALANLFNLDLRSLRNGDWYAGMREDFGFGQCIRNAFEMFDDNDEIFTDEVTEKIDDSLDGLHEFVSGERFGVRVIPVTECMASFFVLDTGRGLRVGLYPGQSYIIYHDVYGEIVWIERFEPEATLRRNEAQEEEREESKAA